MKIDQYKLRTGSDLTFFEFTSEGPNGSIQKLILFQQTDDPNFYNLAFGDKDLLTGDLDDTLFQTMVILIKCLQP